VVNSLPTKRCKLFLQNMQVKWTIRASKNLDSILAYIAKDNPLAAKKFLFETLEKVDRLETFPLLGRVGIVPSTRELVIHENYIVYYSVDGDRVQILRVLHVRRKYP
jgi:toxin ParE1/3/4